MKQKFYFSLQIYKKKICVMMANNNGHHELMNIIIHSMDNMAITLLNMDITPLSMAITLLNMDTNLLNMVIKTELCPYTEYRIYPGRGQKLIAKDEKRHGMQSHESIP